MIQEKANFGLCYFKWALSFLFNIRPINTLIIVVDISLKFFLNFYRHQLPFYTLPLNSLNSFFRAFWWLITSVRIVLLRLLTIILAILIQRVFLLIIEIRCWNFHFWIQICRFLNLVARWNLNRYLPIHGHIFLRITYILPLHMQKV